MNRICENYCGIKLFSSSDNNNIIDNDIKYNDYGVWVTNSSGNPIFHNNFVNNYAQVNIEQSGYANSWDNGVEGNYWSNYTGIDLTHDGVGDYPHTIHANNIDHYPLMGMFSSFNTSLEKYVNIISNSTIENFEYFESNSTITMHVSNMTANQAFGFCRVCIPYTLMDVSNISVFIDGGQTPVLYHNYTLYDNGTHRWIYFVYQQSTHEIDIVPEFPSVLILPLFMIATLLAVIVYRRKHSITMERTI
jgi:parallel beta-helix repeat protein